jgi:hypothetical protein
MSRREERADRQRNIPVKRLKIAFGNDINPKFLPMTQVIYRLHRSKIIPGKRRGIMTEVLKVNAGDDLFLFKHRLAGKVEEIRIIFGIQKIPKRLELAFVYFA